MDKIFIKNLVVHTIIGVNDWEKCIEQKLLINVTVTTNIAKVAKTDDINDALNYAELIDTIKQWVSGNSGFQLIEAFAENLAEMILENFVVQSIVLSVAKPNIVDDVEQVGIEIERSL